MGGSKSVFRRRRTHEKKEGDGVFVLVRERGSERAREREGSEKKRRKRGKSPGWPGVESNTQREIRKISAQAITPIHL